MGSFIYNKERFNQTIDFIGLNWKHPREYSAWSVSNVDIRFELIRYKLYFEIEVKTESVNFFKTCGSQKMAMFKLHQVLEEAGITAPLCWATHKQPLGKEVIAANCIVQDYLEKGKWIRDGKRTVKEFMSVYIDKIIHPVVEFDAPHCTDCKLKEGCVANAEADEDEEQACPLFERGV